MVAYHFLEFWKIKGYKGRMREREKKKLFGSSLAFDLKLAIIVRSYRPI